MADTATSKAMLEAHPMFDYSLPETTRRLDDVNTIKDSVSVLPQTTPGKYFDLELKPSDHTVERNEVRMGFKVSGNGWFNRNGLAGAIARAELLDGSGRLIEPNDDVAKWAQESKSLEKSTNYKDYGMQEQGIYSAADEPSVGTGTLAYTTSDSKCAGTGTAFDDELAVGDWIEFGGMIGRVSIVSSATAIVLDSEVNGGANVAAGAKFTYIGSTSNLLRKWKEFNNGGTWIYLYGYRLFNFMAHQNPVMPLDLTKGYRMRLNWRPAVEALVAGYTSATYNISESHVLYEMARPTPDYALALETLGVHEGVSSQFVKVTRLTRTVASGSLSFNHEVTESIADLQKVIITARKTANLSSYEVDSFERDGSIFGSIQLEHNKMKIPDSKIDSIEESFVYTKSSLGHLGESFEDIFSLEEYAGSENIQVFNFELVKGDDNSGSVISGSRPLKVKFTFASALSEDYEIDVVLLHGARADFIAGGPVSVED